MQIFSHVRMLLARRPWIYWTSVGAVALALALVMHSWVSDLRHQRNSWGTTASVLVASSEIPPGAALDAVVTSRRIPQAAVPPSARSELPDGATARQAIAVGEIIVEGDLAATTGALALLPSGWLAMAVEDANPSLVSVGDTAALLASGSILTTQAVVVRIIDTGIVVGVPLDVAGAVADAAHQHLITVALSANPSQR